MKLLVLVLCWVVLLAVAKASPYNKYGRTCKDILCIAGQEECIMENDPCASSFSQQCGRYPTCKRKASATKRGCASLKCDPGHFCSIRQENCSRPPCEIKPVCIAFRTTASSSTSVLSKPNTNTYNKYGSLFGSTGQQYGSRGQQYGSTGQQYGSTGQQYGNTGQRSSWSWASGR